jgi:DNA-binding MurR/RpiR family transcriptional regulator
MILEKIRQIYPELTKSQKRLADYVATAYREAAFMTASQLAERVNVNEATVIRFAQRMGYSGYPELMDDVQATVQEELHVRRQDAATQENTYLRALESEMEHLGRTVSHLSGDVAQAALKLLREKKRIYVLGQGVSASLAELFRVMLCALGKTVEAPSADPLGLAIMLEGLDADAALVVVSLVPEGIELVNAVQVASQMGVSTLAFTWSPVSPCAQASEIAIHCPANEAFLMPSFAAAAALLDALVQVLAQEDAEAVRERNGRVEQTRNRLQKR